MLNDNPWSDSGFRLQVVCLVIAPSFIAASIYLTVRHLILYYGPEYSRLKPRLYTWVFIGLRKRRHARASGYQVFLNGSHHFRSHRNPLIRIHWDYQAFLMML